MLNLVPWFAKHRTFLLLMTHVSQLSLLLECLGLLYSSHPDKNLKMYTKEC